MSKFVRMAPTAAVPELDRPTKDNVISGNPVFTTWNIEERDGLYCGLWQATPGKWRVDYDEWEFCRILFGRAVITDAYGTEHPLGPGDSFIIRPGFSGTWEVFETVRKEYVIRV